MLIVIANKLLIGIRRQLSANINQHHQAICAALNVQSDAVSACRESGEMSTFASHNSWTHMHAMGSEKASPMLRSSVSRDLAQKHAAHAPLVLTK